MCAFLHVKQALGLPPFLRAEAIISVQMTVAAAPATCAIVLVHGVLPFLSTAYRGEDFGD
jgi:hypothetical protein